MKEGMITVTVVYPNNEGSNFDKEYYNNTHIPLVIDRIGSALMGTMVEFGLGGGAPGSEAPYATIATMYFNTVEDFQTSFGPHADEIMGDIPNFTNVEPSIQISEIAKIATG